MATIRRAGFGSVFEVENEKVGIGTTGDQTNTLQVLGNVVSSNAAVIGISTIPQYKGFLDKNTNLRSSVIDIERQSGSMSNIIIDGDVVVSSATTFCSSVNQLTVTNSFGVPTGNTDDRVHCQTAGSTRFNEDLGALEFYTGDQWMIVNSRIDSGNRGRGVLSGGGYPSHGNTGPIIEFIQISTLGNSTNFGTNTVGILAAGNSDSSRGTFSGGFDPFRDVIEYITMATEGNTIDFGDLTDARAYAGSASSSTRGLIIGGYGPAYVNTIDYIEIQTLGNAIDFGDCIRTKAWGASTQSPTRGVFMSGTSTVPNSGIEFVTISSRGNAVHFGETTKGRRAATGGGNSVRGIFVGGYLGNADQLNTMDYVTLASEGNAIDFGENLFTGSYSGATSNGNRMVIAGGYNAPSTRTNSISYVTIATRGNAQDFGDMSSGGASGVAAVSDSHGGLGGF